MPGTREHVRAQRLLAACGITAPPIFAILLAITGSLQPGYDQVRDYISPLGIGPFGAMQNANFVIVGLLIVGFVLGLHRSVNDGAGSITGPALMVVAGLAFAMLGVFTTCNNWCTSGIIHDILFFTVIGGAVSGLPILARRLRRDGRWRAYANYSALTAVASFAGLMAILLWASTDTKTLLPTGPLGPYAGLLQKLLAGIFILWVEVMALRLMRVASTVGSLC